MDVGPSCIYRSRSVVLFQVAKTSQVESESIVVDMEHLGAPSPPDSRDLLICNTLATVERSFRVSPSWISTASSRSSVSDTSTSDTSVSDTSASGTSTSDTSTSDTSTSDTSGTSSGVSFASSYSSIDSGLLHENFEYYIHFVRPPSQGPALGSIILPQSAATKSVIAQNVRPASRPVTRLVTDPPRFTGSPRYLIAGHTHKSILTPRYVVSDDISISSSAEEMNRLTRAMPSVARISGADLSHSISVTILPSVRGGIVSVNDGPPTQARGVNEPLSLLNARPASALSTVSLNFDAMQIYESMISLVDNRDMIFESRPATECELGDHFDVRCTAADTPNGTMTGMHVAATIAAMIEINTRVKVGIDLSLSAAFLYRCRKNRPMYGINAREALHIALKKGIAERGAYSWVGDDDVSPEITSAVFENAAKHKLVFYARIVSKMGLKRSLAYCGAAYILLPLYAGRPRFWCCDGNVRSMQGVQSALVVGYTPEGFIITVWSSDWIGDRIVLLPYSDYDSVIECWSAFIDVTQKADAVDQIIPAPPSYHDDRTAAEKSGDGCCRVM